MANKLSTFTDVWTNAPVVKMDDIDGQEITIIEFTPAVGRFGEYLRVKCKREDDDLFFVNVSAPNVMKALKAARMKRALPVTAVFTKVENVWTII